ncbi:sulfite exporter TauE/SafE family protein [Halomonas sp. 328]|uniref:sulfite exporter TauE/SafE family protein n=1 Tax=Halomonas sp. 328 TaxID=2776704 RepID=UPI0018A74E4C|nr:sulfite exporter TauE/SafE family protein [Halomonas sp. 328]MBF8223303.1 sulfite exporter TauE/SafE family protein [Halomonas sp. 328]
MPEAWWLEMAPAVWSACALVLLLGALVQRVTGFGLAVVGAPLLLLLEPCLVPVILVIFGLLVSLMMVRRYYREIRLDAIGMALVGRLPGNALGLWLLVAAPLVVLEKVIALIVLSTVAITLGRFRLPVNRASLFGAGVVSGIFGTVAAIGGPPLALLLHGLPPDRLRGNLAAYFIVTASLTLALLALAGRVGLWHWQLALSYLPAVLVGHLLGAWLAPRLNARVIQAASLTVCTLAALVLLF